MASKESYILKEVHDKAEEFYDFLEIVDLMPNATPSQIRKAEEHIKTFFHNVISPFSKLNHEEFLTQPFCLQQARRINKKKEFYQLVDTLTDFMHGVFYQYTVYEICVSDKNDTLMIKQVLLTSKKMANSFKSHGKKLIKKDETRYFYLQELDLFMQLGFDFSLVFFSKHKEAYYKIDNFLKDHERLSWMYGNPDAMEDKSTYSLDL